MRIGSILAVTAMVVATSSPLAAQNLTGAWQVTSETPRGTQTITLSLAQNGGALSGNVTLPMGGRRGGGDGGVRTVEIQDGTVDGNAFSFQYAISRGGNSFTQSYSGTYEGDSMEGMIEGGRGGGRPFSGERGS